MSHDASSARRIDSPRPRRLTGALFSALVRREAGPALLWMAALATAAAVAAAYQAYGPPDAVDVPLYGRFFRRFDLAVLGLMIPFLVLRMADRIEADHRTGWLGPYTAATGSRAAFGAAYALTGMLVPLVVFVMSSVAFALAVTGFAGSAELARLLPRTLGAGLLLLYSYAGITAAVGILVRSPITTFVIILTVTLIPQFVIVRYLMTDAGPPIAALGLQLIAPLLALPGDSTNVIRAVVFGSVMLVIAVVIARRYAGRTT
jgi:hypothetical protein